MILTLSCSGLANWAPRLSKSLTSTPRPNTERFGFAIPTVMWWSLPVLTVSFAIDNETGEGVLHYEPLAPSAFLRILRTSISSNAGRSVKINSPRRFTRLASHAEWLPMRVDTLMQRLGAHYERLRDLKRDLKGTLEDFVVRGWMDPGLRISCGRSRDRVRPST